MQRRTHLLPCAHGRSADTMARSPPGSGGETEPAPGPSHASVSSPVYRLWDDAVLRIAFLAAGLLLAYQLAVTWRQLSWIGAVTCWLQGLVAWSGVLVVGLVSRWLTRAGLSAAHSWWWVSAGLLFYALASTVWLVEDQFLLPNHVHIPSWHDLFFVLQYPCFLLALLLIPRVRPSLQHAFVILDACLLLGAALALSWYFLLAPIYLSSQQTLTSKLVNLIYPVGDLALFFGLTMTWLHLPEYAREHQPIMSLLFVASACLFVADTWFALLLLHTSSYRAGSPPDLFWMAFYLLLPLAALVRFRLAQRTLAGVSGWPMSQQPQNLRRQDLIAGLRITFPVAAALLAATVLFIRAEVVTTPRHPLAPPLIALGLLGLALLRQGLTAVDNERLRPEPAESLRATTAQIETFLGIAGHEFKNPLMSMQLGLQLVERRIRRLLRREREDAADVELLLEPVAQAERQGERLERLVTDLVDVARVRAGRLELHLEPTELGAVVRQAVVEQRLVNPERTFLLECPAEQLVPVTADCHRLRQSVTNYLSNTLQYSPADCRPS